MQDVDNSVLHSRWCGSHLSWGISWGINRHHCGSRIFWGLISRLACNADDDENAIYSYDDDDDNNYDDDKRSHAIYGWHIDQQARLLCGGWGLPTPDWSLSSPLRPSPRHSQTDHEDQPRLGEIHGLWQICHELQCGLWSHLPQPSCRAQR